MDIFCNKSLFKNSIIHSTRHFYVLCDAKPLCEGHLLIIPKRHMSCFQTLSREEVTEYENLQKIIKTFLVDRYGTIALFEHGAIAQTVPHAHMHFLPTSISIKEDIQKYAKKMKLVKIPYLFYEYDGKLEYYKVTRSIPNGFLHQTYRSRLPPYTHAVQKGRKKIKNDLSAYIKENTMISLAK